MSRKKPSKPMTAAQREAERRAQEERRVAIAARRAERRELESRGITVYVDPRDQTITGRVRLNCFNALLVAGGPEFKAVEWLEALLRTASGENTQERRPDHIRASADGAPGQGITADMIEASETLAAVEENLYPAALRLLFGLLKPDAALSNNWRSVVQAATGETNPQAQGAVVRAAAANLQWVRQNIDRLQRERRDRRRMAA